MGKKRQQKHPHISARYRQFSRASPRSLFNIFLQYNHPKLALEWGTGMISNSFLFSESSVQVHTMQRVWDDYRRRTNLDRNIPRPLSLVNRLLYSSFFHISFCFYHILSSTVFFFLPHLFFFLPYSSFFHISFCFYHILLSSTSLFVLLFNWLETLFLPSNLEWVASPGPGKKMLKLRWAKLVNMALNIHRNHKAY